MGSKDAIYSIDELGVREGRSRIESPQPLALSDAPLLDANAHFFLFHHSVLPDQSWIARISVTVQIAVVISQSIGYSTLEKGLGRSEQPRPALWRSTTTKKDAHTPCPKRGADMRRQPHS